MPDRESRALERLAADGLVRAADDRTRTTPRWQAALARAALALVRAGDTRDDLRVPVAMALVEIYGDAVSDAEIVALVEAMLPVEAAELAGH